MKILTAFVMLAFYGLAVCTVGGMLTSGFTADFAVMSAVAQTTIGIVIVRMMWGVSASRRRAF